eukprot:GDKK01025319.1.p1 GENE.GDKK01025319.1~~GDKK01025319.1.p1  ORF type:complete len:1288 (-),score=261.85 GDKK01025319.1:90-3953(-)
MSEGSSPYRETPTFVFREIPKDDDTLISHIDTNLICQLDILYNQHPVYRVIESNIFFFFHETNLWFMSDSIGSSSHFFKSEPTAYPSCLEKKLKWYSQGTFRFSSEMYPIILDSQMFPRLLSIDGNGVSGGYLLVKPLKLPTKIESGHYPVWKRQSSSEEPCCIRKNCQEGVWVFTSSDPNEPLRSFSVWQDVKCHAMQSPIFTSYKKKAQFFNRFVLPTFDVSNEDVLGGYKFRNKTVKYSDFVTVFPETLEKIVSSTGLCVDNVHWMTSDGLQKIVILGLPNWIEPKNSILDEDEECLIESNEWRDSGFPKQKALEKIEEVISDLKENNVSWVNVRKTLVKGSQEHDGEGQTPFQHCTKTVVNHLSRSLPTIEANSFFLFRGISIDDLRQGNLGNCWFVAALSSMAEFPLTILIPFINHLNDAKLTFKNTDAENTQMKDLFSNIRAFYEEEDHADLSDPNSITSLQEWYNYADPKLKDSFSKWLDTVNYECPLMPSSNPTKINLFTPLPVLDSEPFSPHNNNNSKSSSSAAVKQIETLEIDQFIPSEPMRWYTLLTRPLFSKPVGREGWVLLLEKALAKRMGSYRNSDGGICFIAWVLLLGIHDGISVKNVNSSNSSLSRKWGINKIKPFEVEGSEKKFSSVPFQNLSQPSAYKSAKISVDIPKSLISLETVTFENNIPFFKDEANFFKVLVEADQMGLLMAASILSQSEEKTREFKRIGLEANHAYSLISAIEVEDDVCGSVKLVKLRNPWRREEYQGRYSDDWTGWKQRPILEAVLFLSEEESEKTCQHHNQSIKRKKDDDGIFFMEFTDFCQTFTDIHIGLSANRFYQDQKNHPLLDRFPRLWRVVDRMLRKAIEVKSCPLWPRNEKTDSTDKNASLPHANSNLSLPGVISINPKASDAGALNNSLNKSNNFNSLNNTSASLLQQQQPQQQQPQIVINLAHHSDLQLTLGTNSSDSCAENNEARSDTEEGGNSEPTAQFISSKLNSNENNNFEDASKNPKSIAPEFRRVSFGVAEGEPKNDRLNSQECKQTENKKVELKSNETIELLKAENDKKVVRMNSSKESEADNVSKTEQESKRKTELMLEQQEKEKKMMQRKEELEILQREEVEEREKEKAFQKLRRDRDRQRNIEDTRTPNVTKSESQVLKEILQIHSNREINNSEEKGNFPELEKTNEIQPQQQQKKNFDSDPRDQFLPSAALQAKDPLVRLKYVMQAAREQLAAAVPKMTLQEAILVRKSTTLLLPEDDSWKSKTREFSVNTDEIARHATSSKIVEIFRNMKKV